MEKRCSGASQIYLSVWLKSIESKEGDDKKYIWGTTLLVIFLCSGRAMNFLRAPATAQGDEEQMRGQRLGGSAFPGRGRSASVLVRLTLQQESENSSFGMVLSPKKVLWGLPVLLVLLLLVSGQRHQKATKGLASSQAGSFQATLPTRPLAPFLGDLSAFWGYQVLRPTPCNKARKTNILLLNQQSLILLSHHSIKHTLQHCPGLC